MEQFRFFTLILMISLIFLNSEAKLCGDEEINNCKTCGKFEGFDICETCEDNYFLVMDNLLCLRCNDSLYGQIGCEGNCDASDYKTTSFVFCDECIDGYYNLNGICTSCNKGSPGCKECTYELENESTSKEFKCQKCLSNEYKLENYECNKCYLDDCDKCHYEGEELKKVCDNCQNRYYLDSQKTCSSCHYKSIYGGACYICSDDKADYNSSYCYCSSGYTKVDDHTCIKCSENCANCEYNKENKTTQCKYCNSGYALDNSDGKCLKCEEEGCISCYVNEQKKTICTECIFEKYILGENKCLICPSKCDTCEYDETTSQPICVECYNGYVFNPLKNECVFCYDQEDTGTGCAICIFNSTSEHYQCLSCYPHYFSYNSFVYVSNLYKCFTNENPSQIGLYGCLEAIYNETSRKYECLSCRYDYIPVITDKSCIPQGSNGLSGSCYEAEKIGDKYSCVNCDSSYTFVKDIPNGINNCFERMNEFSFCLNGTILENNNKICDVCSANSELNNYRICECNKDSFNKSQEFCSKCNDKWQGNPGCDLSEGCTYKKPNDELRCNKCIKGYFEYTEGQCFSCSNEITNCNDCHFDSTKNKLICDSCVNDIYTINSEYKCQIDDCEEYPEISPGCIICKGQKEEYLQKKQCQSCKYGYFKDKNNKCIYCKSEKYGGPGCYECGYYGDNENNIICKGCYSNDYTSVYDYYYGDKTNYNQPALSSDGKCYDCQIEFSEYCRECGFVLNSDGTENLKCTRCSEGHYLTPEGRCLSFFSLINNTKNCREYGVLIGGKNFTIYSDKLYYGYYYGKRYNFTITSNDMKGPIKSACINCKNRYFLNDEEKCEYLSFEKCTFLSVLNDYNNYGQACRNIENNYVKISLPIKFFDEKGSDGTVYEYYYSISELYEYNVNSIRKYFIIQYGENNKYKMLLDYSGNGNETSPINLKNCDRAYYFPSNNSYICKRCQYRYTLDNNTYLCFNINDNNESNYNKEYDCTVRNIGTKENPNYSCVDYSNNNIQFTLVTYESGQTEFLASKNQLEGCISADANTTYNKTLFNCNKCYYGYAIYFSKFFGRYICQNIKGGVIRKKEISLEIFKNITQKVNVNENKTCNKDYLFTPDGKYCYKCNNEIIGNPGCKGGCSFSLKRNDIIKCQGECKTGYIEVSEGVCATCDSINEGCYECHYETEYPSNYTGIKRKRRFVCDYCLEGYLKSPYDTCLSCEDDLNLKNCNRCKIDLTKKNNYVCTQCEEGFFINEEGKCEICYKFDFKSFTSNKCADCDDTSEGGIENCIECESDGKKVTCKECDYNYILLTNNNSCLERNNTELQYYDNCLELTLINNKLECTRCTHYYSLIDKKGCVYTASLYDRYFYNYHRNHYMALYMNSYGQKYYYYDFYQNFDTNYSNFKEDDYIYMRNADLYSCQKAVNLGTEHNPLYSCIKCMSSIYEGLYDEVTKITEINSNISFCMLQYRVDDLKYCKKATYKMVEGKGVFNCTGCVKNYALAYNKVSKTYYCTSTNATNKCLVLYCKNCNPNDGYVCEECLPDYEVSKVTGSCVKKTEVVPAITWKDIYKLEMNGVKKINNKVIHGPTLFMTGITTSQINTRHAFLIYLTFKLKTSLRNLKEGKENEITIDGLCEIQEGVEQTSNDVNIVEYGCVGNTTKDLDNYQFSDIVEGNNKGIVKNLDLQETANKKKNGEILVLNEESSYTTGSEPKYVFEIKDIKGKNVDNYIFNLNIRGILNNEITLENPIETDLKLSGIDKKASCKFTTGEGKTANLVCNLDVQDYKNVEKLSFATTEIKIDDNNQIFLSGIENIELINAIEKVDNNNNNNDNNNNNNNYNNNNDKSTKTAIIAIAVIFSFIVAVGAGIGIFFLVRAIKSRKKKDRDYVSQKRPKNNNKEKYYNSGGESKNKIDLK